MCADLFSSLFPIFNVTIGNFAKFCSINKKNIYIYISNRSRQSRVFSCTTKQNDFVFLVQIEWNKSNGQFRRTSAYYCQKYRDSWHDFLFDIVFRLMNALSCYFRSRYVAVESIRSNKQARTQTFGQARHIENAHSRNRSCTRIYNDYRFPSKKYREWRLWRYSVQNNTGIRSIVRITFV